MGAASSDIGVFVDQNLPKIRPTHLARVTVDPATAGHTNVVVGRAGRWALYRPRDRVLDTYDLNGNHLSQQRFENMPDIYYRDRREVLLDPPMLVVSSNESVSIHDLDGEGHRYEHGPWGDHCRTGVAVDRIAGGLWFAVPDVSGLAGARTSGRGHRFGRPARLVRWNWATDTVEDDLPLCRHTAVGYGFKEHPREGDLLVSASLGPRDQESWVLTQRDGRVALTELGLDGWPMSISPDGREVLWSAGDQRELRESDRIHLGNAPLLRVGTWPEGQLIAEIDDASLFARVGDPLWLDGFGGPTAYLDGQQILTQSVRDRVVLINRTTMTATCQLDFGDYERGGGERSLESFDVIAPSMLLSYDNTGRHDIWALPGNLPASGV